MKYILLAMVLCLSGLAQAELDKSSRDLLIQKLNKVQISLAPNDPSKAAVTLRLADLLADRARLEAQADLENGCVVCNAGQEDRAKALKLYKEVVDKTADVSKGKVLIQIGHLLEMTGQQDEAATYYQKVLAQSQNSEFLNEAKLSLAEMAFKKHEWANAKKYYTEVLAADGKSSKGLAAYREGWCFYNLGELDKAVASLKNMLVTPALLTRSASSENQADPQFTEEISRDLVTFMAQKGLSESDAQDVFKLSPDSIKVANLQMLAAESERLGKKKEALKVWKFAQTNQAKPEDRLDSTIHIAALELDAGDRAASIASLDAALTLWSELKGCGKMNCEEPQKYLRSYIVNWNKAEKKTPSVELLNSYQKYVHTFTQDYEMMMWGVQTAKDLNRYDAGENLLQAAVEASIRAKNNENLERSLLAQIEMAEASKDEGFLGRAQDQYLRLSTKKDKAFEVRYQIAQQMYEKSNYEKALPLLKELALNKQGAAQIRKQAADLALDGLVVLKDDARLIEWAQVFGDEFATQKGEFLNIKQKAILTLSAKESTADMNKAWTTLATFNMAQATDSDKVQYLKNKILLAEKRGEFTIAAAAADDLLNLKVATPEDREFATGRRAWYAELQLDFATALKYSEKLGKPTERTDSQLLKLAIYADLSGVNSKDYYVKYLGATQDVEAKQIVAAELVRKSKNQQKEIEAQRANLEKNPELLAHLLAEVYVQSKDDAFLKKFMAGDKLKTTTWGKVLARTLWNKEYTEIKAKLDAQVLDGKSQKTVAATIKLRAQTLEKAEALANKAIESGDWTEQLLILSTLAKESDRFYGELMSLPIPEGLSAEDEGQYMSLLGQQAGPYKNKAELAKAKVSEFWALPNWQVELKKTIADAGELAPLVLADAVLLGGVSRESDKTYFAELGAAAPKLTTGLVKEVEAARNAIREKPFDKLSLEKLLEIEKNNKNFAMVQYLEGRLKSLPATSEVK